MQYSSAEIRFLMGTHTVEHATLNGQERIGAIHDLREAPLNCPEHIFERILKDREKRIGPRRMAEFRASQRYAPAENAPTSDLDARVEAAKLF